MMQTRFEWKEAFSLPQSHYIDNQIYLSKEIHGEEIDKIYGKVWAFVAHESELPQNGDYITTTVGKTPIVLVRDESGTVRAFLNICPHRGAALVRNLSGNGKAFACLFHRWSFDTKGHCVSAPQPDGFRAAGVEPNEIALREFRVGQTLGLIFVTLDDDNCSLQEYIGDALEAVRDVLTPEPFEVFHYHRIIIPTNWKLWAATNIELYHVWLHSINRATSLQVPSWLQRKVLTYPRGHVAFGSASHDYTKRSLGSRGITLPGLGPNEARLAHLFPDMLINIRSSNMRLDRLTPLDADRVMVECRGLGVKGEPDDVRKRRIDDHNQFWGPFGRNVPEDGLAAVVQMRALQGGGLPYSMCAREDGTTPATSDEPLRHFYAEWSRLMGRPSSGPTT